MENTVIKDYRLIRELGRGGMAKVYLSEHLVLKTNFAVKILNKDLALNSNFRGRFLSEAKKLSSMQHPGIVKVFDYYEDEYTVAFIMEYVKGETAKEYLDRSGKLPFDEIKRIFIMMLDSVSYVHSQNLVHRDIKPSNFMINQDGKVILMDFGIAKSMDPNSIEYTQTETGIQLGTPMYMSPEQVLATNSVTFKSDIYSLGVILWQLITGRKPYNTETLSKSEIEEKIRKEPLNGTGSSFDALIQKSTQKKPDLRYNSCIEFKNEIESTTFKTIKISENKLKIPIIIALSSVTIGFFIYFSITKLDRENKIENPENNLDSSDFSSYINSKEARNIFLTTTETNPDQLIFDSTNCNFIIGLTSKGPFIQVDRIEKVNENWQIDTTIEIGNGNWDEMLMPSAELMKINNENYFYFVSMYDSRATQSTGVVYNLLDNKLKNCWSIVLEGEPTEGDAIDGSFTLSSNLENNSQIRPILEKKIRNSKYYYKKTNEDYNIDLPKNFEKKFNITNPQLRNEYRGTIKFQPVFYTEDITQYLGSPIDIKENRKFKVFNFFKKGIIVFDKKIGKYSLVYLQDNFVSIFSIELEETNRIIVKDFKDPVFIIDLNEFTYTYIPPKKP